MKTLHAKRYFLCQQAELEEGQSRGFDPEGSGRDTLFVVKKEGRLYAYRNACPHYEGARMAWRKDEFLNADASRIMCFAHGASFRIEDGECIGGPCIGRYLTPVPLIETAREVWLAL